MDNKNLLTTATVGLSALALGLFIGSRGKNRAPTQLTKTKPLPTTVSNAKFKLALCQLMAIDDKKHNLKRAAEMVKEAASKGADVIMLPEMFTCPYTKEWMLKEKEYASEDNQGETYKMLSSLAQETGKYIIGGSIPEQVENSEKIYNTCLCFDKSGKLAVKHRKIHLFDVNIPGGIVFQESDFIYPGDA